MTKFRRAHVMGVVWVIAIASIGALVVVLRKPDAHAKFEHPHRQIVAYEPSAIELSENAYLRHAAPPPPAEPPPPVVMRGAKIVGEQVSPEPQKLAHSLEGVAPTGTTVR